MAQLRDAQTSELLAEGTPLQVAIVAEELGLDNVIFDDVGADPDTGLARMDPGAVVASHEESLQGLRDAAAAAEAGSAAEARLDAEVALREGMEAAARALAPEALETMTAARERAS